MSGLDSGSRFSFIYLMAAADADGEAMTRAQNFRALRQERSLVSLGMTNLPWLAQCADEEVGVIPSVARGAGI